MVAGVVEGHEDAGEEGDDDGDHHPLQIEPVTDVGGALRGVSGGEEKSVVGFPEWVELFELAVFLEERSDLLVLFADKFHLAFLPDLSQDVAERDAVVFLAGANEGADGEVFFDEFQAAEFFGALDVPNEEGAEEEGGHDVEGHDAFKHTDGDHGAMGPVGGCGHGELFWGLPAREEGADS